MIGTYAIGTRAIAAPTPAAGGVVTLAAALVAASALSGSLEVTRALASTTASVSALSGSASVTRLLSASLTNLTGFAPSLHVVRSYGTSITIVSDIPNLPLSLTRQMQTSIAAASAIDPSTFNRLAGMVATATTVSAINGSMDVARAFSANLDAISSISATLTQRFTLLCSHVSVMPLLKATSVSAFAALDGEFSAVDAGIKADQPTAYAKLGGETNVKPSLIGTVTVQRC